jgi:hypothetical protein
MEYSGINLREIAFNVEEETVRDTITEDEREAITAQLVEKLIQLDQEIERFTAIREAHKDRRKELTSALAEFKMLVRRGYRETIEPVYQIKNSDTGTMDFVRSTGEVIRTRRLLPTERQEILSFNSRSWKRIPDETHNRG